MDFEATPSKVTFNEAAAKPLKRSIFAAFW